MIMATCMERWRIGAAAIIAAAGLSLVITACDSAPGKMKAKVPLPFLPPAEFEREWDLVPGPGGPLPDGWTTDGQHSLCFEHKDKQYCPQICVATNPEEPNCIYVKWGDCDPSAAGWVKYCESAGSSESLMLVAGPDCTTTIGTVSHDPLTGLTDVDMTVACTNWVDPDLIGVFIAHPTTPGTFLDSDTFRAVYGSHMPAGSRVQFSGDMEETAWNTFLLKVEFVEFETTTGDDVASAIVRAGNSLPVFAVTVVNEQVVDVRPIYDPR